MAQARRHDSAAARQAAYRERQKQAHHAQSQAKGLPPLPAVPGQARWRALLQQAQGALQTVCQEMESYAVARSQGWPESEHGEAFAERFAAIEEVLSSLQEIIAND